MHTYSILQTLCLNTDFVEEFILDYGSPHAKMLMHEQRDSMVREIIATFERDEGKHIYHHKVVFMYFKHHIYHSI